MENGAAAKPAASEGSGSPELRAPEAAGKQGSKSWQHKANGEGKKGGRKRRTGPTKEPMWQQKRRRLDEEAAAAKAAGEQAPETRPSHMHIQFSKEEIDAEERRPKRKCAVLIGYAGTGYKGMQINHNEKTIEGDIFAALVAAGAISKANATDPQKTSMVRCARTDKGVHAAGNVISLKLIVEDEDIVQKINAHLPDQIRVWGILRTLNGFSCYQACDSRWYEYLLPSYSLLPPHPNSYLGKQIVEAAKKNNTYDEMMARLDDVKDFWEEVEEKEIRPTLERLDPELRQQVLTMMHANDDFREAGFTKLDDIEHKHRTEELSAKEPHANAESAQQPRAAETPGDDTAENERDGRAAEQHNDEAALRKELSPAQQTLKEIKAIYVAAKRRYRITPARLEKLQAALDKYTGTNNFYNYTIQKSFKDASAKRHIKSFVANPTPIQIRDTEWLSLKVHGQSFMMHQIRKMVAMAVMLTRCGSPLDIIEQSYESRKISIPKAPSLGLLLERPVFESYNTRIAEKQDREPVNFDKYEEQIQAFKDEYIYKRMFEVEEMENIFHIFFNQLDNFKTGYFLWVTAGGLEAASERKGGDPVLEGFGGGDDDEDDEANGGEG